MTNAYNKHFKTKHLNENKKNKAKNISNVFDILCQYLL